MVLYDDKKWLCRLIRTSFTIEDISGVCEKVLKEKPYLGDQAGGETSSGDSEDSFDIRDGADLGHRRRSNTAIRLEKLDKQKKALNSTQIVRVTENDVAKNELIFESDYRYTDLKDLKRRTDNVVHVDKLLKSAPHPDSIPYGKYSRFEASCHPSIPCKRLVIFVTFLPLRVRQYPITVAVVSTAKVIELIGLVLWITSKTHPDVKLKTVHQYNFQISDVDGEWDNDFPALDHQECIAKFSFSHLALCTADGQGEKAKPGYNFTFLLPNAGELRVGLDPQTVTIRDALDLVFEKSGWVKLTGNVVDVTGYHLEKLGNPKSTYKDLSMMIGDTKCREFCVVRNGSKSVQAARVSDATSKPDNEMPGGRSELFRVTVTGRFNRVRTALCVIYGRERMDLEFQTKIKTYPFTHISGVKLDTLKNRVLISLCSGSQSNSSHLQLSTADVTTATELHNRLHYIIESYPKPIQRP